MQYFDKNDKTDFESKSKETVISSDSNLTIPSEHIAASNEISKSLEGSGFNTPRESIEHHLFEMTKLKSWTDPTKKWNGSPFKIIVETNESAYADTLGNPETADYRQSLLEFLELEKICT